MLNPEIGFSEARQSRQHNWRTNHPDRRRTPGKSSRAKRMDLNSTLPFCAVDGEGGGTDDLSRQRYLLLRAGDQLLFNANQDLRTEQLLSFLCDLPNDRIYVAYYFDYDVTMILRHATSEQRDRILKPIDFSQPLRQATYIGDFEVQYMPHKYFKVRPIKTINWTEINDVGQFFQCSFVKAITDWEIGTPEQRALIKQNKERRNDFEIMTETEIEYNRLECELLEQLVEKFRNVCKGSGYLPDRWQGPGYLASEMLRQNKLPKTKTYELPRALLEYANKAYYGGRFELTKIGSVNDVYEYDINSAYPNAMLRLPCLTHGKWSYHKGARDHAELYVAEISFSHDNPILCNLPIRNKQGSISWPQFGRGWYWSWEIDAAIQAGTKITKFYDEWSYQRLCTCHPFEWIIPMYNFRRSLGKSTKGYALKLGLNSLYGKSAQSIGSAPYANPIWAGLITADCRTRLIQAYSKIDQRNVVMLATDGVYTTEPLPHLIQGSELGQWEHKHHDHMFLVQPGIYFSSANADRPKTRGVPMARVLEYEDQFRSAFTDWFTNPALDLFGGIGAFPSVEIPIHHFIGLKLAQARNKPWTAGQWHDSIRSISFDFTSKRTFAGKEDHHVNTISLTGKNGQGIVTTVPYSRHIGAWREDAEEFSALCLDQPDFFAFSPADQERVE